MDTKTNGNKKETAHAPIARTQSLSNNSHTSYLDPFSREKPSTKRLRFVKKCGMSTVWRKRFGEIDRFSQSTFLM
jgi:hypothetical protein